MKKRPTNKLSGAMYRSFKRLEAKLFLRCLNAESTLASTQKALIRTQRAWLKHNRNTLRRIESETALRLEQCGKLHATFNERCNELDSKLRAIEARVTMFENDQSGAAASFEQRLAEAEGLLTQLADRLNQPKVTRGNVNGIDYTSYEWGSPPPIGMTRHLHPSDQKCTGCAPEPLGSATNPFVKFDDPCPRYQHIHERPGGGKVWCGGIKPRAEVSAR